MEISGCGWRQRAQCTCDVFNAPNNIQVILDITDRVTTYDAYRTPKRAENHIQRSTAISIGFRVRSQCPKGPKLFWHAYAKMTVNDRQWLSMTVYQVLADHSHNILSSEKLMAKVLIKSGMRRWNVYSRERASRVWCFTSCFAYPCIRWSSFMEANAPVDAEQAAAQKVGNVAKSSQCRR